MFGRMAAAAAVFGFGLSASAAGFDGKHLTTNDWFDADFTTGIADGSAIVANSTTGIVLGAGSWTAVPSDGTATVVADDDAGGGATMLAVNADDEELTFTPSVLASATGMETLSIVAKSVASGALPSLDGDVQAAFSVLDDGTSATPCGYTSDGWTNLVYGGEMSGVTNAWITVDMDFANVGGVRYVRYAVTPAGGSRTVLSDAVGTSWFQAGSNATTITSLSFSGTGSCRTFNGDSLAEIPVAEVNGVSYGSLNDAIAAANAGDTVTLVRNTFDNEAIAATKSVTVALGAYNLTAESFSVSSGSTLTFTGTGSVTAPAITGGGSLVFSNDATLNLTGGTSALAAITADGNLTVSGNGTMSVSGGVSVSGTLTFTPDAYATAVAEAHGAYTIKLSAATIDAGALSGGAYLETSDGITVGGTSSFYGTIAGAGGVSATGSILTLSGAATFTGVLEVKSGTVAIDSSLTGISHSFRLDASVADSILENDGGYVTNWVSQSGTLPAANACFTNEASAMVVSGAYFGGRNSVSTRNTALYNEYFTGGNNTRFASHFIGAVRLVSQTGEGGAMLWGTAASNHRVGRRNNSSTYAYWTKMRNGSTEDNSGIWQNGEYANRSYVYGESVLSVLDFNRNTSAKYGALGGGAADLAIGELIGFTEGQGRPNIETLHRVETYLANKWGIPGVAKSLAATVPVALTSGAVLDLGGLTLAVASLSGSGTVQNGTLTVTDPISVSVGQTLVIPYGSTYTCASGTGANIDTTAGTVTFVHKAADIDGVAYDTVQGAILAYESGTLTIHENATGIDLGTTEVNISGIVVDDGVSAPTFSTTLPWQTTYSEGSLTHARVASTFVYVGPAAYAAEASNFEIGGVVASDVPGTGDTVQFDTATTISIGSENIVYSAVILNANVTVIGAGTNYLYVDGYTGAGKLILGDGSKLCSNAQCTIATPLEIAENATAVINVTLTTGDYESQFVVAGAVTGSGTLNVTRSENSSYGGIEFSGDTSGFYGTINERQPKNANAKRNSLRFCNSDFSNASVNLTTGSGSGNNRLVFSFSNASSVIKFGSLNGVVSSGSSYAFIGHATIEVGNLGNADSVSGKWVPDNISSDRAPYIRKVGTGTLTTTAANAYGYILNGGTLKVLATDTAPVTTEVSGMKPTYATVTIDDVEYKVYRLVTPGIMLMIL